MSVAQVLPDNSFPSFLSNVLKTLGLDALKVALPIVNSAVASGLSNPTVLNIAALKVSIVAQLAGALPSLEQSVIKDELTIVASDIQAFETKLTASTTSTGSTSSSAGAATAAPAASATQAQPAA